MLFGTGFRPFFLGAAALAAVAMAVWSLALGGMLPTPGPMDAARWHAHEMLYGFTAAVLAGFLLTAVQNWTKQVTARGPALAGVFAIWLLGRLAAWVDLGPVGIALDAAFLFVLAGVIARPLWIAGSQRNYAFVGLLLGMGGVDLSTHLGWLGPARAHRISLQIVVLILVIIGGRIVPMFTRNTLPNANAHKVAAVDKLALGLSWAVLAAEILAPVAAPWLGGAAGLALLLRMRTWGSLHTFAHPMLWILHLGYAWIAIGLLLRIAPVPSSVWLHALTAGGIGTLALGMMTRVSLGHTGRVIVATPWIVASFLALGFAVGFRLAGAFGFSTLVVAGVFFSMAYSLFFVLFVPVLLAARPDGRAG